jgi:hypothetical protein
MRDASGQTSCAHKHPWGSTLPGDTGWRPMQRGFCFTAFRGETCRYQGCINVREHRPGPRAYFNSLFNNRDRVRAILKENGWDEELITHLHEDDGKRPAQPMAPRRQVGRGVCFKYKQDRIGSCRFGSDCRFLHQVVLGQGTRVPGGIRPDECPAGLCYPYYLKGECDKKGDEVCQKNHLKAGDISPAGR